MTDILKGLPIRTEADADERVQVKVIDGTTVSQKMTVDSDGNAHAEVHGNDPSSTDRVLRLSEQGHAAVSGEYHASNNTDPSSVGLIGLERNASPADSQQTLRVTAKANTAGDVRAIDVAIRGADGEPISATNPLYVVEAEDPGTEIVNYDAGVGDVASAGSAEHDYTVTALKTLVVDSILCSASARGNFEVKVETGVATGIYTSRAKGFVTSATPSIVLPFSRRLKVSAGVKIRVTVTNTDNQAQAMYTTLVGVEV